MEFAWGKANGCRGLSAGRSLEHMQAWVWLMGDDDFWSELDASIEHAYQYYGKPQLVLICNHYGLDWSQWDDGIWRNFEDSAGQSPAELGYN